MAAAKQPEYLTAEAIFDAPDELTQDVDVPEWKGVVKVKSMTKGEHQDARRRATRKGQIDNDLLELEFLAVGLAVPKLNRSDLARLKEKHAGAVERIIGAILKVSGLSEGAGEEIDRTFRD